MLYPKGENHVHTFHTEKSLLRQALAARENAYAPYSRFQVGAVLTVADGSTFCGCNIENASYSMTICAERSSVCAAVSAGVRQFRRHRHCRRH